jgi:nanoRNase/pAp phosphatase (c-di-AMP/oligoRNAs hydrolase)
MVSRLVLGFVGTSRAVVDDLADEPGELTVVADDETRVRTLREEGIRAQTGDVTDRALLSRYDPDVVLVDAEGTDESPATTRAATEAFPDAHVVTYLGYGVGASVRDTVATLADEVVTPGGAIVDEIADVVGSEAGVRAQRLRETVRAVGGPMAVVMHDNPDPDAIASALALREIAAALGVEATACYYGEISHQENRALMNLLELDLRNLGAEDGIEEFASVALVDHSRPGVNDQLPEDLQVDVVVDHHPPRAPVEARFIDLRHGVGATSTLMVDYFDRLGVPLDETVATALLFGIRVDTSDFSREVSTEDFVAASRLVDPANLDLLERVEEPSVSPETLAVVARAVSERTVDGTMLASYVGSIADRDALAQAADLLLAMEGITTTLVCGRVDETVYVSARARGADLDLGEALRLAFDQIGSAGGHADMAGAQIPLKSIVQMTGEHDRERVIRDSLVERFFETVRDPSPTVTERGTVGARPEELGLLSHDTETARRADGPGGGGPDAEEDAAGGPDAEGGDAGGPDAEGGDAGGPDAEEDAAGGPDAEEDAADGSDAEGGDAGGDSSEADADEGDASAGQDAGHEDGGHEGADGR